VLLTWIFLSEADFIYLSHCGCWGGALQKSPRFRHFKSDLDEIWQDCTTSKYGLLTESVGFLISCHTLRMVAMTSALHVADAAAYAGCPLAPWASRACDVIGSLHVCAFCLQFLILCTFVFVSKHKLGCAPPACQNGYGEYVISVHDVRFNRFLIACCHLMNEVAYYSHASGAARSLFDQFR